VGLGYLLCQGLPYVFGSGKRIEKPFEKELELLQRKQEERKMACKVFVPFGHEGTRYSVMQRLTREGEKDASRWFFSHSRLRTYFRIIFENESCLHENCHCTVAAVGIHGVALGFRVESKEGDLKCRLESVSAQIAQSFSVQGDIVVGRSKSYPNREKIYGIVCKSFLVHQGFRMMASQLGGAAAILCKTQDDFSLILEDPECSHEDCKCGAWLIGISPRTQGYLAVGFEPVLSFTIAYLLGQVNFAFGVYGDDVFRRPLDE